MSRKDNSFVGCTNRLRHRRHCKIGLLIPRSFDSFLDVHERTKSNTWELMTDHLMPDPDGATYYNHSSDDLRLRIANCQRFLVIFSTPTRRRWSAAIFTSQLLAKRTLFKFPFILGTFWWTWIIHSLMYMKEYCPKVEDWLRQTISKMAHPDRWKNIAFLSLIGLKFNKSHTNQLPDSVLSRSRV